MIVTRRKLSGIRNPKERAETIEYLKSKPYNELTKEERISAGRLKVYPIKSERDRHLRHRYGILESDYDALFEAQNGVCAICKKPAKELYVDHSHETGAIRGLLCPGCNTFLGVWETREHVMSEVIEYLYPFISDTLWMYNPDTNFNSHPLRTSRP